MENKKIIQVDEKVPIKLLIPLSIQHMLAEAGPGTAALFHFPQLSLLLDRSPPPAVTAESVSPSPHLDGLRRPPRLIS